MTINERFDMIITDLYGGNKSAFASAIGVTPSVVDNIVGKRQGKPSFDVVEKVSALAEVNVEWLIRGTGEPFNLGNFDNTPPSVQSNGLELRLLEMLSQKDDTIRKQAMEIGRLEAQLETVDQLRADLKQAHDTIRALTATKNATTHSHAPTTAPAVP